MQLLVRSGRVTITQFLAGSRNMDDACPSVASFELYSATVMTVSCRSWRTDVDGGTCVLVSVSMDSSNAECLAGCVRGDVYASHFCLQPLGSTGCRLTHYSHSDLR